MNYWIFKCNPNFYRIDDRLKDPNPVITWKVTRHLSKIKDGDIAFIWKAIKDRGIVGAMRLHSDPQLMYEIPSELPYEIGKHEKGKQMMVTGAIIARKTITTSELKAVKGLAGLSVFHPPYQGTNFRVTYGEGQVEARLLMKLLGLK